MIFWLKLLRANVVPGMEPEDSMMPFGKTDQKRKSVSQKQIKPNS